MINIPPGISDIKIIGKTDCNKEISIQIRIPNDTYETESESIHNEQIFFCFQNRQKTVFYPMEYAYIESTSNHYSKWHPTNPNKPVMSLYMRSLGNIYTKLHKAGLNYFWRVHASYIVNISCIKSLQNDKIILKDQNKSIPIGKEYKEEFFSKITVF